MTFGFCTRVVAIEKKRLGVGWVQSVHSHNHSGSHTEWAVGPLANQCAGILHSNWKCWLESPPMIWVMEWLISSQLIPYLLPSDYHTSTQSAFILHILAFLILCAPPSLSLSERCWTTWCAQGWHVQWWHFKCTWLWALYPKRRGILPALIAALKDANTNTLNHIFNQNTDWKTETTWHLIPFCNSIESHDMCCV